MYHCPQDLKLIFGTWDALDKYLWDKVTPTNIKEYIIAHLLLGYFPIMIMLPV